MVAFAVGAKAQNAAQSVDTLNSKHSTQNEGSRFAVQKTVPDNTEDLERKAVDLRNPENLTTETTYDERTHTYIVGNKMAIRTCRYRC